MDSLRTRLILSHTLPLLISILLIAIALIYVLETQVILANLSTQLTRQASLVAEIGHDYPTIWDDAAVAQAFAVRFQNRITAQLMLLQPDGRLLASSDRADLSLVGQSLSLPAVKTVQTGQISAAVNYSQNRQAEVADVLVPVFGEDQQVVGIVRLTHVLGTIQDRFWRLRYLTLQVLITGLLLGMIFGILLADRLEQPIVNLTFAILSLFKKARTVTRFQRSFIRICNPDLSSSKR